MVTQPDFVAIVRSRLSDDAKASPEKRQKLYQSLRDVLRSRFSGEDRVQGDFEIAQRTLEAAIATVERECVATQQSLHGLGELLAVAEKELEPTRLDKWLQTAGTVSTGIKAKYGILAGIASFIGDFLKPVFDMTQPVMIGSAVAGVGLYALSRMTRTSRTSVLTAAGFSAVLCLCSTGWLAMQSFVPGAKAKGAVAQLVPGASAVQDAVIASLGRIEGQTKRIADTLDAESERKRQQEEQSRKDAERETQQRTDDYKKQITEAGYSLDPAGYMNGVKDGYTKQYLFDQIGIKPTREALAASAPNFTNDMQVIRLVTFISSQRDNFSFIRELAGAMLEDRTRLAAAFQSAGAQHVLCDPKSYTLQINTAGLNAVCRTTGLKFAAGYLKYFVFAYGTLTADSPAPRLTALDFMKSSPEELPIAARVGRLVFSEMKQCAYYEGTLEYFSNYGLNPWGSFQSADLAASIAYFDVVDRDFGKDHAQCQMQAIASRRQSQCRARVIMAASCEGYNKTVIKLLTPQGAAPSAALPSATPAAARNAAPGPRADGPLSRDEVQTTLIGKEMNFGGENVIKYDRNGTLSGGDGRFGFTGNYRVENDGRVCGTMGARGLVCFQFYRRNGVLGVRRTNGMTPGDIGPVTLC